MTETDQTALVLLTRLGALGNDELAHEISGILLELGIPDTSLSNAAAELGVSHSEFNGARVSISQPSKGFDSDVAILITVSAPSINHVLKSIWDQIILPAIKARLGPDAIGKEVAEEPAIPSGDEAQ